MSLFISQPKINGVYNYADKMKKQILYNDKLIKNPILIQYPDQEINKRKIFKDNFSETTLKIQQNNLEPETNLKYPQKPFLTANNRFFWTIYYENPKNLKNNNMISRKKIPNSQKSLFVESANNYSYFPKRPPTRNKHYSGKSLSIAKFNIKNDYNETFNSRPGTSSTNIRENLNFYNEVEEFEYHAKKVIEPTEFIDKSNCPHGMTNLRKKEVNLFEKFNENGKTNKNLNFSVEGRQKSFPNIFKEDEDKLILEKAIYEQNFTKARKILRQSLSSFKKIL